MEDLRLFHVSEEAGIQTFLPRPSPSHFKHLTGDVVFAIDHFHLHNYLLPRDCPRVTFYADDEQQTDPLLKFSTAQFVVAVESAWFERILQTTLYCYELPVNNFTLLDKTAGYYVSYAEVKPIEVTVIDNLLQRLLSLDIELRFMPDIKPLAEAVAKSELNFSLIRMRNAGK
ncbi:DUF6886 family protein [Mucilaginibacter paludis]|uniref:Uncharacterized protein n=1 Tax=Mucilaginibacter paludis DSM 18603 TaxID=714943 RepID=H1Y0Q7_9SPHI|nr:DUF6886 family protein [Mucilaginibacter paludis]EHQ28797.1 hypothetical protein Mucpa_4712 [Mucilaginibacter paludis DSM 18603]